MPTPAKTSRPRRLRRILVIATAVPVVVLSLWLLDHARPRHAHFEAPRGPIEAAVVEPGEPSPPGVLSESVRVRASGGRTVHFAVVRPEATDGPVPLIVLLGGLRTGRHAVTLVGDPGPVAIAALDYPYTGPEKIRGARQAVASLPAMQQALLDTPPAVSLALDWLLTQPWVDHDRVELIGVSLGTPFACVAGALDTRFRRVWLIHGGADNREWLRGALRRRIPNDTLRAAAASTLHLLAHGASFDTADWVGRIAPRPVVVIGARDDESLTRANIERLHDAAGDPRELIWTDGGHIQRSQHEVVRQLLRIVTDRLDQE